MSLGTDLTMLRLSFVTCRANGHHALEEKEEKNPELSATLWATTLWKGASGEVQKQGASKLPATQTHRSSGDRAPGLA